MKHTRGIFLALLVALVSCPFNIAVGQTTRAGDLTYASQAADVMRSVQQNFYDEKTGLYYHSLKKRSPEFIWGSGVTFSALVGASRHEPDIYLPLLSRFFKALDQYWDAKAPIPGYEPVPTRGNGNDKYYDDNEWMVLTLAEAFELTHDQQYLQRAQAALQFSLSGWNDQLGGGILWRESPKDPSKNTCSNAPAAVACLRLAKFAQSDQAKSDIAMAAKIVDWTNQHFQTPDGLYKDNLIVSTHKKNNAKLTYNTALMIRADLGLYRWTCDEKYLQAASKSAKAADWFLDQKNGAYRDSVRWAHLQVEADLEMYRATHEEYLLKRAKNNADFAYAQWKMHPPDELIDIASIARVLYLMADTKTRVGKQFWLQDDKISR